MSILLHLFLRVAVSCETLYGTPGWQLVVDVTDLLWNLLLMHRASIVCVHRLTLDTRVSLSGRGLLLRVDPDFFRTDCPLVNAEVADLVADRAVRQHELARVVVVSHLKVACTLVVCHFHFVSWARFSDNLPLIV